MPVSAIVGTAEIVRRPRDDVCDARPHLVITAGASVGLHGLGTRNHPRRVRVTVRTDLDPVAAQHGVGRRTEVTRAAPIRSAGLVTTGHPSSVENSPIRADSRQKRRNSVLSVPRRTS
jgi:hypothetical protein